MTSISMNGNSSDLECMFFPPLEMEKNTKICLLSLETNNSIPNINDGKNRIGFSREDGSIQEIIIPTGSYELSQIENFLVNATSELGITFELKTNLITLKCEMQCDRHIDLSKLDSIAGLLGFGKKIYMADYKHVSEYVVNIMNVNSIKVHCNLVSGSFDNGLPSHTLHEFFMNVPPGFHLSEVIANPVYYPLNTTFINQLRVTLKDQDGKLIDLRGEPLSVRLHLKRDN
ncbi:uncharacterized protein LOC126902058 [Daktulosphaira vitifoliae]|uniref:uncharacterized protein LOC126902058 n=1 Tax=Daktulosphaira vitifoliae TaxID=58002 RepID=UPI0021A9DB03|nr:uncharacterized protein LOC126902058 [Daktulosphaira vitifoliae]